MAPNAYGLFKLTSQTTLTLRVPEPIQLSICICTSGRLPELERSLASVSASIRRAYEVIVSDDSSDEITSSNIRAECEQYSFTTYVRGPGRGLCANRNHVIQCARGTHVSLVDDDAIVSPNFVARVEELVTAYPLQVLTGDVLEDGVHRQSPTNSTFLGHFGRPPRPGEPLVNVNLNCNVFPRAAFDRIRFDETIRYGYEDTDLCGRLVDDGWTIRHCPELINKHCPPPKRPDQLRQQMLNAETARGMVQVRTRRRRGQVAAALGWSFIAAAHSAASAGRHADLARLRVMLRGIRLGWSGADN